MQRQTMPGDLIISLTLSARRSHSHAGLACEYDLASSTEPGACLQHTMDFKLIGGQKFEIIFALEMTKSYPSNVL